MGRSSGRGSRHASKEPASTSSSPLSRREYRKRQKMEGSKESDQEATGDDGNEDETMAGVDNHPVEDHKDEQEKDFNLGAILDKASGDSSKYQNLFLTSQSSKSRGEGATGRAGDGLVESPFKQQFQFMHLSSNRAAAQPGTQDVAVGDPLGDPLGDGGPATTANQTGPQDVQMDSADTEGPDTTTDKPGPQDDVQMDSADTEGPDTTTDKLGPQDDVQMGSADTEGPDTTTDKPADKPGLQDVEMDSAGTAGPSGTAKEADAPSMAKGRKGGRARQRSTLSGAPSKPSPFEVPGNPSDPKSFIVIESNEQKVAAYLGFSKLGDLRSLAASTPVKLAMERCSLIEYNLRRTAAFHILHDDEENIAKVLSPHEEWPLQNAGSKDKHHYEARHLAWILLELEDDLTPSAGNLLTTQNDKIVAPELGPREGEDRMESLNRCWNLLRYFRYMTQANKVQSHFSDKGVSTNIIVDASHIPTWMRPAQEARAEIEKLDDVKHADALPEKYFTIYWDRLKHFSGKEAVDEILDQVDDQIIPTSRQMMLQDPRLFQTAESLRDAIRRQYNCHQLGLTIHSLRLLFMNANTYELQDRNVMTDDWQSTKSAFLDEAHEDFMLKVILRVLEEDESCYESFSPPTALSAYFSTDQEDVAINEAQLLAAAQAATGQTAPDPTAQAAPDPTAQDAPDPTAQDAPDPTAQAAPAVDSAVREENIPAFLDLAAFRGSASGADLGSAPDPTVKFPLDRNKQKLLKWYDNKDVTDEAVKRQWQKDVIDTLVFGRTSSSLKTNKLQGVSTKERELIDDSIAHGQRVAMAMEDKQSLADKETETRYYTMKSAFSGTERQAGPPVDLCIDLLAATLQSNGRYRCALLEGSTKSEFYHYQLTGAVGLCLKLHGEIDGDKLLKNTKATLTPQQKFDIKYAADRLSDIKLHGAILADDVGFGKTKELCLAILLHIWVEDEVDGAGKVLYKPILLLVPPAVVNQWIAEIRQDWPALNLVLSFEDHSYKDIMALQSLTHTAMREYPKLDGVPKHLQYVFNNDPQAKRTVVLSSYETHKKRTGKKIVTQIAGVHFEPPRKDPSGRIIWKKKPRVKVHWETEHEGVYGLLVADEAQKMRNYRTGIFSVAYRHSFPKTILATATPVFNTSSDIVALLALLWPAAESELRKIAKENTDISEWLKEVYPLDDSAKLQRVSQLDSDDPRRILLIDPRFAFRTLSSAIAIHLRVAARFLPIMELCFVRRSAASSLPDTTGGTTKLRGLFKKTVRKTAVSPHFANEEIEYQLFHRAAARQVHFAKSTFGTNADSHIKYREWINQISGGGSDSGNALPRKPVEANKPAKMMLPVGAARKLAMANFSTKCARLNEVMVRVDLNTHVPIINDWREKGIDAEFIQDITRGKGERKSRTAKELLQYLCDGSPACRLVFQELLTIHALDPLSEERYKGHQKLLVGEQLPLNAWYLQQVLRAALIDARVLHAGLSNKSKSDLCDLFNDPKGSVKVLIMMYDVSAVGLNLHRACNRVVLTSIGRSYAAEEQTAGRTSRITSKYPVTIVRKETPNSHDQYLAGRQADKATVQLAANASEPEILTLILRLLQELQPEVDECHNSLEGQELKTQMEDAKTRREAMVFEAVRQAKADKAEKKLRRDAARELTSIGTSNTTTDYTSQDRPRRERKAPQRYSDIYYDSENGNFITVATDREERRKRAQIEECEVCYNNITHPSNRVECQCGFVAHILCVNDSTTQEDYTCSECLAKEQRKSALRKPFAEESSRDDESVGDQHSDEDFIDSESDSEEDGDLDEYYQSRHTLRRKEIEKMLDEDEDPLGALDQDYNEFIREVQPDDETRHRMALLSLPCGHVWVKRDLEEKDFYLRVGLLLLFNNMQGKKGLALGKSIHIRYHAFPYDITSRAEDRLKVSKGKAKKVRSSMDIPSAALTQQNASSSM